MRLRGLVKGTPTGTRGPAPAVPLPSGIVRRHVLLGAAITALGGLLFGYDTGVISRALLFIGKDFHGMTSFDKELLTSILLIGALIGALAAGRIADRVGRKAIVLGPAGLFGVYGPAALYRRDRPAADSRRPGQLQSIGYHLWHPRLLPRGLRAGLD